MTLKQYTLNLKELSIDPKIGLKDYSPLYKKGIRIKEYLLNRNIIKDINSGRTPSKFNEEYWYGDHEFLTMKDVDTLTFSINKECTEKITDIAIDEEKNLYQAKADSLIISNAMTLGLSFLIDRPIYINQNVFEVKLNENKVNKKFVLWYFNLVIRRLFETTYTAKYLSKEELGRIRIPDIPVKEQNILAAQIEPIEKRLMILKETMIKSTDIINKVFSRELRFDLKKWEQIKKKKNFEINISLINTPLLRTTFIQNNESSRYLKEFFTYNTTCLKKILLKPIKRGKQPEYVGDGVKVIKTINIQNGKINFDEVQFVSENYLKYNEEKAGIYKFDLLLTSTGMGRGKFALYEDDETCFADSHISIIRFDTSKSIPLFLNYYCQSLFGLEQLKYIEMHIKGTPEIYEDQLNNFKIPNIPIRVQQKIVDEIKKKLDKQDAIKNKIEEERKKIDTIIVRGIS